MVKVTGNLKISSKLFVTLIIGILILPIFMGFFYIISRSMGYIPFWGEGEFTLNAWKEVLFDPTFLKVLFIAVIRGNIIGFVVFITLFIIGFYFIFQKSFFVRKLNFFFVSIPHVALAMGFAFLVAPSGIIFRVLSFFFGFKNPPNIQIIGDAFGISMCIVVFIKIIPFIVFVFLSVLHDYKIMSYITQARLMGHNIFSVWTFIVFPQILPKIFFPFLITLVYAISPVDIAAMLGPYTPPSIGVLLSQWHLSIEKITFMKSHVGIAMLVLVTTLSVIVWYGVFKGIRRILRFGYICSHRIPNLTTAMTILGRIIIYSLITIVVICILLLIVWSFTKSWSFPRLFPTAIQFHHFFEYAQQLRHSLMITFHIALVSVILSGILVVIVLELLTYIKYRRIIVGALLVPLIIPQIAYVMGIYFIALYMRTGGSFFALVWAHIQYVFPYMFFSLYGPFMEYDNRYIMQGRILGHSILYSLLSIKIPMLWKSIFYSVAIGFTVSVSQYLTTLFIGEGRFLTLTLLMVSLTSGGNRTIMGTVGAILILFNSVLIFISLFIATMQKGQKKYNYDY